MGLILLGIAMFDLSDTQAARCSQLNARFHLPKCFQRIQRTVDGQLYV
ncbi:unnamed protein product [Anisakis simplex]|uniref:Transposase n=1 Tax=Anisakis simplex TaxID=6269 RepID=A0A0M3JLN6_ANISI|nr:unnamed protein product [Anisakis simplex]